MASSRAVAAVKRAKVVEAVADGATYGHAAQQAGYPTRSGAYKAFWKAVDGREADAVDQTGRWSWSVWTRFRSGCGNRR
ncbi:MAG: hypothetical protein U0R23_09775 [Candidatus Nanopelagicales bacterium]